jgi:hypothetical protein
MARINGILAEQVAILKRAGGRPTRRLRRAGAQARVRPPGRTLPYGRTTGQVAEWRYPETGTRISHATAFPVFVELPLYVTQ